MSVDYLIEYRRDFFFQINRFPPPKSCSYTCFARWLLRHGSLSRYTLSYEWWCPYCNILWWYAIFFCFPQEMTVGLPLVSDIAETPRVTIVDSKYTADGKVEPQQRMSPKGKPACSKHSQWGRFPSLSSWFFIFFFFSFGSNNISLEFIFDVVLSDRIGLNREKRSI